MRSQWVVEYCTMCHGSGVVYRRYPIIGERASTCPQCKGHGRLSERRVYTMDDEPRL